MKNSILYIGLFLGIISCNQTNTNTKQTNTVANTGKDTQAVEMVAAPKEEGIPEEKQADFQKWLAYDSKRYCDCLDGYTRFMNEHFWYDQKYDIDSDANEQAVKNSMIVLESCTNCIVETSETEPERRSFLIELTPEQRIKYDFEFTNIFRRNCGQTAEMFLGIYSNFEPSSVYTFKTKEETSVPN